LFLQPPHKTVRYRAFGSAKLFEYFGLNTETGEVYVSKSLQLDNTDNFQVSIHVINIVL